MGRKLKVIISALFIVVLMAVIVFSVGNISSTNTSNAQNNNPSKQGLSLVGNTTQGQSGQNSTGSSSITLEELSKHNSEEDCWVVYKSKVYDLTSWLPKHPGSAVAIMPYCGTQEFETAFKRQHGNSKASLFFNVAKLIGDINLKGSLV